MFPYILVSPIKPPLNVPITVLMMLILPITDGYKIEFLPYKLGTFNPKLLLFIVFKMGAFLQIRGQTWLYQVADGGGLSLEVLKSGKKV